MCGRRLHNSQVAFYETMWLQRPGVMPRPVLLRANKCFRGRERRHAVLVKASNGEIWIAVLILFIKCIFNDEVRKCALVQWFEDFGSTDSATMCKMVRPEMITQGRKQV
jgi:hypothetical protein